MAIRWMKLDIDFWHSPEFVTMISRKGEAAAFKVIKLYCLASELYGVIDMTSEKDRLWVESEMGFKGKRLNDFISDCVDCGIFDRDMWEGFGKVTCNRLSEAGMKRRETEEKRRAAGEASGRSRRGEV